MIRGGESCCCLGGAVTADDGVDEWRDDEANDRADDEVGDRASVTRESLLAEEDRFPFLRESSILHSFFKHVASLGIWNVVATAARLRVKVEGRGALVGCGSRPCKGHRRVLEMEPRQQARRVETVSDKYKWLLWWDLNLQRTEDFGSAHEKEKNQTLGRRKKKQSRLLFTRRRRGWSLDVAGKNDQLQTLRPSGTHFWT